MDAMEGSDDARRPTERVRDIWARAGVLINELARPALFLNLPVRTPSDSLAAPGEPGFLSLRRLLRTPPAWDIADQVIYVCENPNIISIAADRLGADCAPLVCTDGMPAAAQGVLLQQLSHAGAKLLYHGDFDWAGIHIANNVMKLCDARSWRFEAEDYILAVKATRPRSVTWKMCTSPQPGTLRWSIRCDRMGLPSQKRPLPPN